MNCKTTHILAALLFAIAFGTCKANAGNREPLPDGPQLPPAIGLSLAPKQEKSPELKRTKACDTCYTRNEPRKDAAPKSRKLPEDSDPKRRYPIL